MSIGTASSLAVPMPFMLAFAAPAFAAKLLASQMPCCHIRDDVLFPLFVPGSGSPVLSAKRAVQRPPSFSYEYGR
jgi:hypothetical protein